MSNSSKPWKDQRAAYKEALVYINARKEGTITSFKTPWSKVNEAGVNGLEWNSLTVIGGRPGTGKTLIKDQSIREGFVQNKGHNIRVLEFQFEMVARASKVREFCAVLGKSYKYICSAYEEDKLSKEDFDVLHKHSQQAVDIKKYPVDIVEKPCTVDTLIKIIESYMEQHATIIHGEDAEGNVTQAKVYTNTVITLDHSYLLKKAKGQGSKTDMLYDLGEALTSCKRRFPIAFIILSQLGRHVETPERNENGKYGNYILETDFLGGDALFQHADLAIGINRPAMKFIQHYGPDRYSIAGEHILVFHFLKTRTGDTRMSFFKAEFAQMRVVETDTPGVQQKRISTN